MKLEFARQHLLFLQYKSGLSFSKLQGRYERCDRVTDCQLESWYRTCREISEPISAILVVASDPTARASSLGLLQGFTSVSQKNL